MPRLPSGRPQIFRNGDQQIFRNHQQLCQRRTRFVVESGADLSGVMKLTVLTHQRKQEAPYGRECLSKR
jgi:hypothetical protein